jgi:hypothetical protein
MGVASPSGYGVGGMVAEVYLELRELILRGDPHAHGWAPTDDLPRVWGALVEVGMAAGPATLVGLRDGTTSLYLGNGSATIGAGAAASVAEATLRLLAAVEGSLGEFAAIWELPIPETGHVRMVALTYTGPMGAEARQVEVEDGSHALAGIFAASGAVLSEIERLEAAMPATRE